MRKYRSVYVIVYEAFGYVWEPKLLPYHVHLSITEANGTKTATLHSYMYNPNATRLLPMFSSEFSDEQILKEIGGGVLRMVS